MEGEKWQRVGGWKRSMFIYDSIGLEKLLFSYLSILEFFSLPFSSLNHPLLRHTLLSPLPPPLSFSLFFFSSLPFSGLCTVLLISFFFFPLTRSLPRSRSLSRSRSLFPIISLSLFASFSFSLPPFHILGRRILCSLWRSTTETSRRCDRKWMPQLSARLLSGMTSRTSRTSE